MLTVLGNRTYRRLFTAQVVAVLGTGLATVALSLLAYDLAGDDASAVLGTALAIKMVAYVAIAPVVTALTERIPRRALLVTMDLLRAGVALALPFVTDVWQIYVLIFLLQTASATFTPAFQATIPQVLPEEEDYTRALSMARLAYDLESLISPVLAAGLLALTSYDRLFAGTTVGFLASAALVVSVLPPRPEPAERRGGVFTRAAFGTRVYLATPRLRALLALNLAVAAAGAMVIVNTVVLVRDELRLGTSAVPITLGVYGVGSMLTTLVLPRLLNRLGDRRIMPTAAFLLAAALLGLALGLATGSLPWPVLLGIWAVAGSASAAILTPSGRLVRRSASPADLPAVFAAQFSLSHACWLLAYPLAGWLAAWAGMTTSAVALTVTALAAALTALVLWPSHDPAEVPHTHTDLPEDHPHLADAVATPVGHRHVHDFVIDAEHAKWPRSRELASR